MTDTMRAIGMGKVPKVRFAELLEPKGEEKSAEQLIDEFLAKYQAAMGGER